MQMARFIFDELNDLISDFVSIATLPDDVIDGMLNAEADIVVEAQKEKGEAYGVHRTGVTLDSIQKGKRIIGKENGSSLVVYPTGRNKNGNRNAEVAFINEFGKRGQKARPFIKDANEAAADQAVAAAMAVYDAYLKSKNL